jgi:hypothetical protein
MEKQPLTLENLDGGRFLDRINAKIVEASASLDQVDNPKAKAEVVIKLVIANADDDGDFRTVTPSLTTKEPAQPTQAKLYPVRNMGGQRVIVVDPEQDGDQMKLPGVASLDERRNAS